jgi:hypothetical protein
VKITGGDGRNPNHWREYFFSCPKVFLNGNEIHRVCEADDGAGFVVIVDYWKAMIRAG